MQNEILICFLCIVGFFDEFNILQKMYSKGDNTFASI